MSYSCSGPHGEQSTIIMGEGRNPQITDLERLAAAAGIESTRAHLIIDQVQSSIKKSHKVAKLRNLLNDQSQQHPYQKRRPRPLTSSMIWTSSLRHHVILVEEPGAYYSMADEGAI